MNRNAIREIITQGALTPERLLFFCDFAERGSIAEAANHDLSKQSTRSKWIGELEKAAGFQLTRNEGRKLVVNEAGAEFARLIRELFAGVAGFIDAKRKQASILRLGAANSTIEWIVAPRISAIQESIRQQAKKFGDNSQVFHLQFEFHRTRDIHRGLLDLTLDLGILRYDGLDTPSQSKQAARANNERSAPQSTKGAPGPTIEARPLGEVGYGFFIPTGLMPSGRKPRPRDLLASLPLVTSRGERFRANLEKAATEAGYALNIQMACASFTQAARVVRGGHYAGILPITAAADLPEAQFRRFDLDALAVPPRQLVVAWNRRMAEIRPHIVAVAETLAKSFA